MNKPRKTKPKPDYSRTPTLAELTIAVTELQADKSSLYAKLAAAEAKIERLTWQRIEATDTVLHNPAFEVCRYCCEARHRGHEAGCIAEER